MIFVMLHKLQVFFFLAAGCEYQKELKFKTGQHGVF